MEYCEDCRWIKFFVDSKFWAIVPAININIHSGELEFEWLCFGLYIHIFGKKQSVPMPSIDEGYFFLNMMDALDKALNCPEGKLWEGKDGIENR